MEKIKILLLSLILIAIIVLIFAVSNLNQASAMDGDSTTSAEALPEEVAEPEEPEEDECEISVTFCPFLDEEVEMLAKVIYAEANGISWYGEKNGVSATARQAAVAWVVLNRYDTGKYDSLEAVITKPKAFAYSADTPLTDEMLALANDVVERWMAEKDGYDNVGRTIPADYYYFVGDGKENYFSKEWKSKSYWDWSLPDPYKE